MAFQDKKANKMVWTEEQIEILKKCVGLKLTNTEIAFLMNLQPRQIGQKKWQLRNNKGVLPLYRWSEAEIEKLIEMRKSGETLVKIGEYFNKSPKTITGKLSDLASQGYDVSPPVKAPVNKITTGAKVVIVRKSKIEEALDRVVEKRAGQKCVNDRFVDRDIAEFYGDFIGSHQWGKFKAKLLKIKGVRTIPISKLTGSVAYDFSQVQQ